jgi:hypothetical protein
MKSRATGYASLEITNRERWDHMTKILRGTIALIGAAAFLAVSASAALAGVGYGAGGGSVKGESAGGGSLPFTGSDMALYAVIAAGIVASGLALRAYSARRAN